MSIYVSGHQSANQSVSQPGRGNQPRGQQSFSRASTGLPNGRIPNYTNTGRKQDVVMNRMGLQRPLSYHGNIPIPKYTQSFQSPAVDLRGQPRAPVQGYHPSWNESQGNQKAKITDTMPRIRTFRPLGVPRKDFNPPDPVYQNVTSRPSQVSYLPHKVAVRNMIHPQVSHTSSQPQQSFPGANLHPTSVTNHAQPRGANFYSYNQSYRGNPVPTSQVRVTPHLMDLRNIRSQRVPQSTNQQLQQHSALPNGHIPSYQKPPSVKRNPKDPTAHLWVPHSSIAGPFKSRVQNNSIRQNGLSNVIKDRELEASRPHSGNYRPHNKPDYLQRADIERPKSTPPNRPKIFVQPRKKSNSESSYTGRHVLQVERSNHRPPVTSCSIMTSQIPKASYSVPSRDSNKTYNKKQRKVRFNVANRIHEYEPR